ncbi:MAG: hypothetical protein JWO56_2646 [Acidobacteria bacterium]|nr:hypothetical protein [Acidobacteriota bacterium]
MIVYRLAPETAAAMAEALRAHGADRLAVAGLGAVRREDTALPTAAVVEAWPETDGVRRVALSDAAGAIAWRAFVLAEVAAGRMRLLRWYEETLGVEMRPAYGYVCAVMKGSGHRACSSAKREGWTLATHWVLDPEGQPDPRGKWKQSIWHARSTTHRAYAAAGLAVAGRKVWNPIATALFHEPVPVVPPPALNLAEEAALRELAA